MISEYLSFIANIRLMYKYFVTLRDHMAHLCFWKMHKRSRSQPVLGNVGVCSVSIHTH